jgi:hypothetical protein
VSAPPEQWTANEVAADIELAIAVFRVTRISEPLHAWVQEVEKRKAEFTKLFDDHEIAHPHELSADDLPAIIEAGLLDALRYLPGPPISTDDLKTIAEVTSLSPKRLRANREDTQRLLDTILKSVDPYRFPWLAENRDPSGDERRAAILASALLHAAQRLQSDRRNIAKREQERAVREHLKTIGFVGRVVPRTITTYAQFPPQGIVSENEINFGPERADVIARLWDDRVLAIECKVSNSAVNSYKRLNHDTLAKKTEWNRAFGESNIVPSAMLAGVYSASNILAAQRSGLTIFWSHRIEDLGAFVESTRK